MRDTIKNKYLPDILKQMEGIASLKDPEMINVFKASVNEYYPMTEKWLSL